MKKFPNLPLTSIPRPRSMEPSSRNLTTSATNRRLKLMIRDKDTSRFIDLSFLTPTNLKSSNESYEVSSQLKLLQKTFNKRNDKTILKQKALDGLKTE